MRRPQPLFFSALILLVATVIVPVPALAVDASYFKTDSDWPKGAKYHVVPISVLLMVRAPLNVTQEFPNGRFQPYLGIGPSLVYSRAKSGGASDTSFDVGFH